jgi:hypothetical protein
MLTTAQVLAAAETLAQRAAGAGVQDNQIAFVLTHLKRHHDVAGTLALLASLRTSPFARRSKQTPRQMAALCTLVSESLRPGLDWREAAAIVGWARRLAGYYRPEGGGRREAEKRHGGGAPVRRGARGGPRSP